MSAWLLVKKEPNRSKTLKGGNSVKLKKNEKQLSSTLNFF